MKQKRTIFIILGICLLAGIFILGFYQYYQERKSQVSIQIPNNNIIDVKTTFDQNYPVSLEETDALQKACASTATFWLMRQDLVEKPETRELLCFIAQDKETIDSVDKHRTTFVQLRKTPNLQQGQYIAIAVNYSDILQKNKSLIPSEENTFNLCTITKPVLIEPFREELLLKGQINLNRSIVFSDGEVFCSKFSGLPDETLNLLISGFVPQTDLFQAKIYFVPGDKTVNDIFSQESFTKIEEILQSYSLLWNVEKPVI